VNSAANQQKTPLGQSVNRHARAKALDQIRQTGRSLPCTVVKVSGSIVTVSFQVQAAPGQAAVTIPNVTIPVIGAEYVRMPIQQGCRGMTVAADAYLGGMSGLGGGIATLTQPMNLTALAFLPLGNVGFFAVNGNILTLYGPSGVTIQDANADPATTIALGGGNIALTAGTSGSISFTVGGHTLVINSSGIVLDGITWGTHYHTEVQPGLGNSGPPA